MHVKYLKKNLTIFRSQDLSYIFPTTQHKAMQRMTVPMKCLPIISFAPNVKKALTVRYKKNKI